MNASNKQRHFIFGYGSLISAVSRAKTGETGRVWPAVLTGYQRHWSIMTTEFGMSSVAVTQSNSSKDTTMCNGVLIEIDENELGAFDIREQGYERALVSSEQLRAYAGVLPIGKIWVYHSVTITHPSQECPITLSYLDVILAGCLEYGHAFTEDFLTMTQGWKNVVINDRQQPRYPRFQAELNTHQFTSSLLPVTNLSEKELSVSYEP